MNTINMKNILFLVLAGLFIISCGEDEYNPYSPENISDNDGSVTYTNSTSYPIIGNIVSEEPTFTVDGAYKFKVNTVEAPAGSTFNLSKFSANILTGAITYENSGELSPGNYLVTVGLANVYGMAVYNNAYTLTVLEVPVEATIDNPVVDAGIFQTGVVATVSYTDTSGSGLITSVEYALVDATTGFSIDKDSGEISKSNPAASGPNNITVKITTNIGAIIEENICVINVGESPTLDYVQLDGTTPLTNATLSPWTAYTTAVPNLVGMIGTKYDIILPAELVEGTIVANADGTISVLADQNLAIGTHSLGVKVTNAGGNEVTFPGVFTLTVENRWEVADLFNDTFDDEQTGVVSPGNLLYPDYAGYTIGDDVTTWNKANLSKAGKPDVQGIRVQNPGVKEHYLVRNIDLTVVRALRVTFGEVFGYNDAFISTYQRGLYSGESTTDLDGGTFDPANWNVVMADDDSRWAGSANWSTRVPDMVNNVDVDLSNISGNTLKLAWYIGSTNTSQNGQYVIDSVKAQYASPFTAEEM